jgi:hypothetical protein
MRRWGVLVGLWLVSGALAQEVRLQEDARLQETLAIQEPFAPLREVLRTVQDATGVPLYADRAVAEDKVCVLTRERPAHEILTRLAETLRYVGSPARTAMATASRSPRPNAPASRACCAPTNSGASTPFRNRSARQFNSSDATPASSWSNSPPTRRADSRPKPKACSKRCSQTRKFIWRCRHWRHYPIP